jgi:FHA domain
MIKCSECGYENMDGLDYCDGCGAKLAASEAPAAAPAAAPEAAHEAGPVTMEPAPAHEAAPAADANGTAVSEAVVAEPAVAPSSEAKTGEISPPPAAAPVAAAAGPSASPHFKAKLSLLRGGRKGQEFPLDSGQNFIGRWDPETGSFPEVDLEQDDPEAKISRKHALIIVENGKITVEDIGSLNGTYVNRGNRLIPGTPLEIKAGDEVIIGKTFLKLVVDPIS